MALELRADLSHTVQNVLPRMVDHGAPATKLWMKKVDGSPDRHVYLQTLKSAVKTQTEFVYVILICASSKAAKS